MEVFKHVIGGNEYVKGILEGASADFAILERCTHNRLRHVLSVLLAPRGRGRMSLVSWHDLVITKAKEVGKEAVYTLLVRNEYNYSRNYLAGYLAGRQSQWIKAKRRRRRYIKRKGVKHDAE